MFKQIHELQHEHQFTYQNKDIIRKQNKDIYLNILLHEVEFCHFEASHLKPLTGLLEFLFFCLDTGIQAFQGMVSGVPTCWTGNYRLAAWLLFDNV